MHSVPTSKKLANVGNIERITFDVLMHGTLPPKEMIFGHVAKLYLYELYDPKVAVTKKSSIEIA